jgi:NAD(P)-dependent dehydrogenase (short-subunit alcohol dehydrogenase family)
MYDLNVKTALNASKAALPYLIASGAGRIVNIGAGAASKAGAGMGAYAAAKAGVARLTEALAAELLDRGVTVNALLPSIIDTPPNRADMPDADFSRWVRPEQLAATIGFAVGRRAGDHRRIDPGERAGRVATRHASAFGFGITAGVSARATARDACRPMCRRDAACMREPACSRPSPYTPRSTSTDRSRDEA